MHDFSLGGPVDVGQYDGPMLKGKPLHSGNCEDGVYGCRKCGRAIRRLTPEERKEINCPETDTCDWCHKEVTVSEISGIHPWDEPSCYYEICGLCRSKYDANLREEFSNEPEEEVEDDGFDPSGVFRCIYCHAKSQPLPEVYRVDWVCDTPSCRERLAKGRAQRHINRKDDAAKRKAANRIIDLLLGRGPFVLRTVRYNQGAAKWEEKDESFHSPAEAFRRVEEVVPTMMYVSLRVGKEFLLEVDNGVLLNKGVACRVPGIWALKLG